LDRLSTTGCDVPVPHLLCRIFQILAVVEERIATLTRRASLLAVAPPSPRGRGSAVRPALFHQLHQRVQRSVYRRRDTEFFTALDNVTIERIDLGGVAAREILSHRGSRIGHGIATLERRLHKLLDTGERNSRRLSHEDNLPNQLFDDATGERIIFNRAI